MKRLNLLRRLSRKKLRKNQAKRRKKRKKLPEKGKNNVLRVLAPAKINLFLHITGKRSDGYHLLNSLVVFSDIADLIEIKQSEDFLLNINGPFSAQLNNCHNIIEKAVRLLADKAGIQPDIEVRLVKNLPVGSGIGGGSSDAAATIKLLNKLWDLNYSNEKLADLSLELGADLPVCVTETTSLVSGIGEIIRPLSGFPQLHIILVNHGKIVPTAEIFKMGFNKFSISFLPGEIPREPGKLVTFLKERTSNDLYINTLRIVPDLSQILEIISAQGGCLLSRMSGSGATCFGLFADQITASNAADFISQKHPEWWVQKGRVLN